MTSARHLTGIGRGAIHVAFAAVRLSDIREWIDLDTLSGDRIQTERKVVIANRAMGLETWVKANPVIRIAEVTVREVSEVVELDGSKESKGGGVMKHTKEPWDVSNQCRHVGKRALNGSLNEIASLETCCYRESLNANARRIVACVNGCEGINPEAVKGMLEALRLVLKWREGPDGLVIFSKEGAIMISAVKAAIAKAEGG